MDLLAGLVGLEARLPGETHAIQHGHHHCCMRNQILLVLARLGYLFDAFALRDRRRTLKDVLSETLLALRRDIQCFNDVFLLHEPNSDQLFFVNAPRLRSYSMLESFANCGEIASETGSSAMTFVRVEGSCVQGSPPPIGLRSLLADLASQAGPDTPCTVSLPEDDRTRDIGTMVAFAACILEFEVAYVPTLGGGGGGGFLSGVPLDVYECILELSAEKSGELPESHTLIKFSCPQALANSLPELRPEAVVLALWRRFDGRLKEACFPGTMRVHHSVETLDRVAL
ncbi:hypothetical protein C8Q77DRAFT_898533 [Trametes polyzona]|nr:hypothetical protein C8Q77DRAFT_898533 [Trametes polyzona]